MKLSDSSIFPGYVHCPDPLPLINEPDDYGVFFPESNYKDQKDLDLINAKAAWNLFPQGQVGDPNLKIAINDGLPDVNHEDLQGKVTVLPHSAPYPSGGFDTHGTPIAGGIAAATNNGKGIASIGYNLKVHASTKINDTGMHELSLRYNMKLINASWMTGTNWPDCFYPGTFDAQIGAFPSHIVKQDIYNEIYENGTTCVFAAGNGNFLGVPAVICQSTNAYAFPASYDHNISVTSVGYYDPSLNQIQANQTGSFKNCHYTNCNLQSASHHHNSRVDISAPGYWVKVLIDKKEDPTIKYAKRSGTSIAAPIVTGTLGLMLSKKPCLSPYQLEKLLKSTTDASIYNMSSNSAFAANKELGTGRLDAYAAVNAAQNADCNDPSTQTMYIDGFTLNHRCPPGFASNGTNPKVKAIVKGARGPVTFRWMPLNNAGNTCKMNNVTSADSNEVYEANVAPGGGRMLYYLVTVSEVASSQNPYPQVASKRLKIYLNQSNEQSRTWDLAMRDSWMDMIGQPNIMDVVDKRDWDIWHSPDLWNRHAKDGILDHIDPEYSAIDSNYLYFRVKNYGCASSPANAQAFLYWTLASTGEKWESDWVTAPTGGRITPTNNPILIPSLAPGEQFISTRGWLPPDPDPIVGPNSNVKVDACVLARIEVPGQPNKDIYTPEGPATKTNVKFNNNVVTRNLFIVDKYQNKAAKRFMYIGNSHYAPYTYSIQVVNQKDIFKHFAGDLSQYMYVVLHLGDLYDRWVNAGGQGEGFTANSSDRTVTYDPSVPLRLDGISLAADENFPIIVEFKLRDGVTLDFPIENQYIHIRQIERKLISGSPDMETARYEEEVFGNVSYQVTIPVDSTNGLPGNKNDGSGALPQLLENRQSKGSYTIYPNPANNKLTIEMSRLEEVSDITITDVTGRTVARFSNVRFTDNKFHINTSELQAGVYFIRLIEAGGKSQLMRFTKIN